MNHKLSHTRQRFVIGLFVLVLAATVFHGLHVSPGRVLLCDAALVVCLAR